MSQNESPTTTLLTADIVIVGATPAGVAAAVTAGRLGRSTILIERTSSVGGMMTNGLSRTDIRNPNTVRGMFIEFRGRVLDYYQKTYGADSQQVKDCNSGLFFEPKLALSIFNEWLADVGVTVLVRHELESVIKTGQRISAVRVRDLLSGELKEINAGVFIDASYEGDLAAWSGVPYRTGREGRADHNEQFAGVSYVQSDFVLSDGRWIYLNAILPGSSGEGDDRIQSYNYRLIMTDDADNRVPVTKPANYDREEYVSILDDIEEGRVDGWQDVVMALRIPNNKVDVNNRHESLISTDLQEENYGYPDGDWVERDRVAQRTQEHIIGLLWFVQNDDALPEAFRAECAPWGWAKDEFEDNEHFPRQMYVREARRVEGEYLFTEHDCRLAPEGFRSPIHSDSVACGDYMMDSHSTRKREPKREAALAWWLNKQQGYGRSNGKRGVTYRILEGIMDYPIITMPSQIPYRVMIPKSVEWLLTPGPLSATHMGYSTLRMEPVWMALGQASAVAADMSLTSNTPPRQLDAAALQRQLLAQGQVVTFFWDIDLDNPHAPSVQYYGARGFFDTYEAKSDQILTLGDAIRWLYLAINDTQPLSLIKHRIPQINLAVTHPAYPYYATLHSIGIALPDALPDALLSRQIAMTLMKATAQYTENEMTKPQLSEQVTRGEYCAALFELFYGSLSVNSLQTILSDADHIPDDWMGVSRSDS